MENQNDQAFEADQGINGYERLPPRSSSSRPSSHKGRDALKAAFGGFEGNQEEENDRTPLLKKGQNQRGGSRSDVDDGEGDNRGPPTWEGERDFEGRPWWNMPSVRFAYPLEGIMGN